MKQIFIESSYQSFEDFHDGKWYEDLFRVSEGSLIEGIVEDFASHWWGASRAFVLPWLLVGSVFDATSFADGKIKSKQELWDKYMENNAFKGALWKTAESSYGSIYYAYENLLVSILNASFHQTARVTDQDFNKLVIHKLGESLAGKLWNNSTVAVAKEVRNCLVHRGGKASKKLRGMKPRPKTSEDYVLISARDVRDLHSELKQRVSMLVEMHANHEIVG